MATSTNPDWDPILLACQQNRLDIVERMLKDDHHQNTNTTTNNNMSIVHHCNAIGQTSLHIASWWGHAGIIECLLSYGANILSQNTLTGATPIHCIIQSSRASIHKSERLKSIELLLNHLLLLQQQQQQQQQFTFEQNCRDYMGRVPLDYLEEDDIDRKDIIKLFDKFENSLLNQQEQGRHKIFDIILIEEGKKNHHHVVENLLRQQVQEILHEQQQGQKDQQQQQQLPLLPTYKEKTPLVYLVEQWCNRDNNNDDTDNICNNINNNNKNEEEEEEEEDDEGNPETYITTSSRDDEYYYYPKSFEAILPLYYFKISSSSTTSNTADNNNNNSDQQQVQQQQQQQLSIVLNVLLEAILDLYIELARKGKSNNSNDHDDDDDTRLFKQWKSAVSQLFNNNQSQQQQPQNSVQHHVVPSPSSEIEERLWMTISRRNYIDLAEWYWSNVVVNIVVVVHHHQVVPTKDNDHQSTTTTTTTSRYANYWNKIVNRQGMTPIQFAARSGHYQLVTWFLKDNARGIDLMHKDRQGITVLDAARVNEHEDIVQLLLEKMNTNN